MKMDPIVYRFQFSNEDPNVQAGFQPFHNENGEIVTQRDVTCQGIVCETDVAVAFAITERIEKFNTPKREKSLVKIWYYGKDNPEYKELIDNLASQELRGRIAERTAAKLYFDLFLFSKWMKHYLPEVVAYHRNHYEKYKFEIKKGKAGFGHDPIPNIKD